MSRFLSLFLILTTLTSHAASPLTFRARLSEDLGTLDWNYGELNADIVYQLMEGLFQADSKGMPVPAAAESFLWNPEKTELTLQLRKNRRWSDGAPLCAQHFVDSWNRLRSKELASPYAHYANIFRAFEAKGCHSLTLSFLRPAPEAPALLSHYVFFPVRLDQLKSSPGIFNNGSGLLVNGPFRVKSWKKNALQVLEPNPFYRGRKPAISRVEFRFIPEDSTAKAMFELKKLDWVKEVPQLLRTPALEKSAEFRRFPSLIVYYFGLNAGKSALLADPEIRRLLSDSLDRGEIGKVLGKECRGTRSWLVPEIFPGQKAEKPAALNAQAIEKLRAAAKEKRMDLVLSTYSKTSHKMLVEWAQGQWEKKIGVRIPIQVKEGKVYWREVAVNPTPIFFGGVTAPFGHPRAFLQEFLSGASANWTGWASAEYDQAVATEQFADAEKILARDAHVIPLYQRDTVALVATQWKGFHINPLGQVFLARVRRD